MYATHKRALESFVRVDQFLQDNPVSGPMTYAGPREVLSDVVRQLREFAGAQFSGRHLSTTELGRQRELSRRILVQHVRPLVAIAKSHLPPDEEGRLPSALRMPKGAVGVTTLLQVCDGMIDATRPYEAAFIANGLPADFLTRFTAVRNELDAILRGRATLVGVHVGAGQGVQMQVRRGRRAVDRLDAIVRASFDGDAVTLGRWRVAKRMPRRGTGVTEELGAEGAALEERKAA